MNEIILKFNEQQLQALAGLIGAAGSTGGDVARMMAAADMLKLIQSQVDAARAAEPAHAPDVRS
jgi:hypothetical protein